MKKHPLKQWRNGQTLSGEKRFFAFLMREIKDLTFSPMRPTQAFSKDLALFYSLPKCVIYVTLPEKILFLLSS